MLFFVPLLISLVSSTCTLRNGTVITSAGPGDKCIECKLLGYSLGNGTCSVDVAYEPQSINSIVRTCQVGECKVLGVCKEVLPGVLCDECNKLGWLDVQDLKCNCYSPDLNPYQGCLQGTDIYWSAVEVTEIFDSWECIPHQDHVRGCFKLTSVPGYKYGLTEYPPVPSLCCSAVYGPEPGQLLTSNLEACNSYGGADPNGEPQIWQVCSGHGTWDKTTYTCTCASNWQASEIGKNIYNETAYSCNICAEGWGQFGGDVCGAPYTPHVFTGYPSICGGVGEYSAEGCNCYSNNTIGYWTNSQITRESHRLLGNGTMVKENVTLDTCGKCQFPYIGPTCLEFPFCLQSCPTIDIPILANYTLINATIPAEQPCPDNPIRNALYTCQYNNCTMYYRTRRGNWEFYTNKTTNDTMVKRAGTFYIPC